MYPGFVHSLLYDTDYDYNTTRKDLNLPLDFNAPVHGIYSGYSDASKNGVWINMMVRPDHYLGAGHHHADAGMFHFSALAVDWFTESPFSQVYDGKYHNQVLVDGVSEPEGSSGLGTGYQATAKYIGAKLKTLGSIATADLTNSYSYRWQTQPASIWEPKMAALQWELDPSEENLKTFAGTSRYKMRPWWATYNYSNYIATSRALFNPMQYVYRSVGMVRGKHAYGIVVDDLKKDENEHLYQWTAMLNGGVWQADVTCRNEHEIILAMGKYDAKKIIPANNVIPKKGDPLLLFYALNKIENNGSGATLIKVTTEKGPDDKQKKEQFYNRLTIHSSSKEVHYRVLLIPFRYGEELPEIKNEKNLVTVSWKDGQKDQLIFSEINGRNSISVKRNGKTIVESK